MGHLGKAVRILDHNTTLQIQFDHQELLSEEESPTDAQLLSAVLPDLRNATFHNRMVKSDREV